MKTLRKILLFAVPAFLFGTALGYFVLSQYKPAAKNVRAAHSLLKHAQADLPPLAPAPVPWDASSPLGKALTATTDLERAQAVNVLVTNTSASKLGDLLNQAAAAPRTSDRDYVRIRAYAKWAASDPQKALDHARAAEQLEGDNSVSRYVFNAWAELAPKDAFAAAQAMDTQSRRAGAIANVLGTWAQNDPVAAAAAALTLSPADDNNGGQ